MSMQSEDTRRALETLLQRNAEIEAAIERLESGDESVFLEPAAIPDY